MINDVDEMIKMPLIPSVFRIYHWIIICTQITNLDTKKEAKKLPFFSREIQCTRCIQ